MEHDDLEKRVRDALNTEAEAGPDYATSLHARIMAHIATSPRMPPLPHQTAHRHQMMMMAAMVIGIALLAFIVFQVMR
jgi:hypothetical protein